MSKILTAAASILGGLVIAVGAYRANRPRPPVNASRPRVPRFDPNSPIEMPTPPAPVALLLAVGMLASATTMVAMPLLAAEEHPWEGPISLGIARSLGEQEG